MIARIGKEDKDADKKVVVPPVDVGLWPPVDRVEFQLSPHKHRSLLFPHVSMPPADTTKRSVQPRSSPSVAPKPHQTLRPSGLQPLSNLRVITSRSTHTGLKTLAQICRRDGDGDGDVQDKQKSACEENAGRR